MLDSAAEGDLKALILVGSDPARDAPDGATADAGLQGADFVVSIDAFLHDSNGKADVVLPALVFGEKDGTVTNVEGRVQKVNAIVPGAGQSRPDWSILDDVARLMGAPLGLNSAGAIFKEITDVAPAYRGLSWDLLEWEARDGVVVPLPDQMPGFEYVPADTPGEVAKGGLVLHSARTMYDDGVMMRNGRSLHPLAPGGFVAVHSDDAARLGLGEGDEATVEGSSGSAALPVVIDDSLARGTVYVPFNQKGVPSLGSRPEVTLTKAE
jgi:predicted molibdopterin-dependent oxidoreductase YjgC